MAKPVRVTKVTVDYEFEGEAFTVVFGDPTKIESIIFSRQELHRLQGEQERLAKRNPPQARPVVDRPVNPRAIPSVDGEGEPTFASRDGASADAAPIEMTDVNRSLWWHTSACAWFHPEETDR